MSKLLIGIWILSSIGGSIDVRAEEQTKQSTVAPPQLVCGCPSGLRRGDISLTTLYQHATVTRHYFAYGDEQNRGKIVSDSFVLTLDYAITDRVVLSAGLPYVFARYDGKVPHQLPIDDGTTHSSAQDYRVDLRYNAIFGDVVVTPAIGFVSPSNNYTYFAHSAIGRNVHEQFAAVNVERPLDEILPGLFAQARYGYTFAEKIQSISHNRSNIDVNIGYFVLPALSVRALWSLQKTYGGIDLIFGAPRDRLFPYHDQISRADEVNVGLGASYSVSEKVDVFVGALRSISGRNVHKIDLAPSIGVTWTLPSLSALRRHSTQQAASCPMPASSQR